MTTLTYTEKLVVESCPTCHVRHAIPAPLRERALENPVTQKIYCPNGHPWWFTGKSEAEQLKEQLEAERRRRASREEQLAAERLAREHAEAQARGYKGAMVQARKRSAKGVCPAPGCKRSFVDVAKHVATKHPELVDQVEEHAHG
jgi:hypothetical protein